MQLYEEQPAKRAQRVTALKGNDKDARAAGAEWASTREAAGARLHDALWSIERIWAFISNVLSTH